MNPSLPIPSRSPVRKPSRPCRARSCANKVRGGGYCPDHEHLKPQKWGTTNKAFYNSTRWRKTTKAYREANPLCEHCEDEGRVTPAAQADHITPIEEGGAKFDWDNLQSLCHSCHAIKTRKEMNND